ncbi:MAG: TetR/AcrR family transcriptional regulator [Trueperaceae bacterium]
MTSTQVKEAKPQTLREKRQEKRTQEILEAALKLFDEKGYSGTSMEDIAEASLLTRAGLYKYFPDKAKLLGALRTWKIKVLHERINLALTKTTTLEQKIYAITRETLHFQHDNRGFFRLLFSAGTLAKLDADETFADISVLTNNVIEQGIQEKKIAPLAPAKELTMLFVSLLFKNSIKRNVLGYEPPSNLEHDVDLINHVFLRGVFLG